MQEHRADLEELARHLLGKPSSALDDEERRVLSAIASGTTGVRDASDVADEQATFGERLADRVAAAAATHLDFTAKTTERPVAVRSCMTLRRSAECSEEVPISPCWTRRTNAPRSRCLTLLWSMRKPPREPVESESSAMASRR